jgi:hypothetical protein
MAPSRPQNLRTIRHLQEQSRVLREDPEKTPVQPTKGIASKKSKSLSHRAQVALVAGGLLVLLFVALLCDER